MTLCARRGRGRTRRRPCSCRCSGGTGREDSYERLRAIDGHPRRRLEAGKRELLAEVIGHRLAMSAGTTQQQVADRMGVTNGRMSEIEQGKVSGHDVLARYTAALKPAGDLHRRGRYHRDCMPGQ